MLPGGVRLPLALLGASKLGFSPFPAGSGTMGCVSTPVTPDVWPPSNPPRQGTAATGCRLWHNGLFFTGFQSGRLAALKCFPGGTVATGSARGLKTWLFTVSGRLWHNGLCFNACHSGRLAALKPSPAGYGCHWLQALAQWAVFLPAFNPDVWPPSNASRRGTVATGSARGFKTWLFTVSGRLWHNGLRFNGFHSGRLAALKPSPAGYGCHWLQALAQWAVFYRLSIRTFGRPQTLPGGVRLPLALLGASKTWLFTVSGRLWHNGLRFKRLSLRTFGRPQTLPGRVRLPLAAGFGTMGCFYRLSIRTFGRPQTLPGGVRLPLALLGASKLGFSPFPAGSGTMGCVLTAFTPDVWPPSNPPRQGTAATGCRLWHNGLFFTGFQSGRLAALKRFPAGYGCHWLC